MGVCLSVPWSQVDADALKQKYLLRNKAQALALKKFCSTLNLSVNVVEKVYAAWKDGDFDAAGDFMSKRSFLLHHDIPESPFAVGALNSLSAADRVEFFGFFCALVNYNTYDREKLIRFTFSLTNEGGTGRLSIDELAVLVHWVYG